MDLAGNLHFNENLNRTREGLPKLTNETLEVFNKEVKRKIEAGDLQPLLTEWFREMEAENPVLLNQIQNFTSGYHPDEQGISQLRMIMLYELLKTQAIDDNLSSSQRIFEYYGKTSENNSAP